MISWIIEEILISFEIRQENSLFWEFAGGSCLPSLGRDRDQAPQQVSNIR